MTSSLVDVLIIGAGPSGLMLACQLSLYPNISFRIIDKKPYSTKQSRTLVVYARSLELFSQLNLVDKARYLREIMLMHLIYILIDNMDFD
jgi:2-polyprenyl-6-methoxyphenol hydroxylase-like FAD-dependent oxidoreductase